MKQRPALSAVLIALNVADSLSDCLDSLSFADEIIVVDGGSDDGTQEIAMTRGARVIAHGWAGFGPQKQFAVSQASHDWVLCIDCDERVPSSLAAAILARIENDEPRAYEMPRSNHFLGRYLKRGEGYPGWSLRLFDRNHAHWTDDAVHERVISAGPVGRIRHAGALLHHSAETLASYLDKQNRYTTLQAEALFAAGKRASVVQLVFSPLLRFVKFYLVRGGFLDGIPGLVHVSIGCFNSLIKYAKLFAIERSRV